MTTVLVDDQLLLRVLLDDEPAGLRPAGAAVATTRQWHQRLRRVLADPLVTGALAHRLGDVPKAAAERAITDLTQLPATVEVVSLESLGRPMAPLLPGGARLSLRSFEALAAAQHLGADLCLSPAADDAASLHACAPAFGVTVRTVA